MINLSEEHYLAKGNARTCYINPEDSAQCIKVNRIGTDSNSDQNSAEKFYIEKSKKIIKDLNSSKSILCGFYGPIETNLGDGLVFELIKDHDGNCSKTLAYFYKNNLLDKKIIRQIIIDIQQKSIEQNVLIYDANMSNILLKKHQDGSFSPKIIDGFGGKRIDLKLKLRCYFPFIIKMKTKSSFEHLLYRFDNYSEKTDPSFLL
ncbi:MAG: YrbL family protein [Vibrio sp.]